MAVGYVYDYIAIILCIVISVVAAGGGGSLGVEVAVEKSKAVSV